MCCVFAFALLLCEPTNGKKISLFLLWTTTSMSSQNGREQNNIHAFIVVRFSLSRQSHDHQLSSLTHIHHRSNAAVGSLPTIIIGSTNEEKRRRKKKLTRRLFRFYVDTDERRKNKKEKKTFGVTPKEFYLLWRNAIGERKRQRR